jgi:superfamily II DNA or RNA helicase
VHRATAATYQRVIDHFTPAFMLGLTATPERSDGTSAFELFDYNVPYEIRLGAALEQEMLSPFHYYGVADFNHDRRDASFPPRRRGAD